MTRHMRNAQIGEAPDHVFGVSATHNMFGEAVSVTAPVAVAFTEDEVVALAAYLSTGEPAWLGDLIPAFKAIIAAADDIIGDDEHEPPLHEEDA